MCLVVSGNVVHKYGPFSFHYILENLSSASSRASRKLATLGH